MDKLEAADKLVEAVEKLLSDNPLCAYCYQKNYEHSQGCAKQATMKLLEIYHQAPAIPPLEKILAAMEFFELKGVDWRVAETYTVREGKWFCALCTAPTEYKRKDLKHDEVCRYKEARDTLFELRMAVGK